MKTTFLQSLFKIALLFIGIAAGAGCYDSDKWDNMNEWNVPKGPDTPSYKITGEETCWKLANVVENGKLVKNMKEEGNYKESKSFTLSFEGDGTFLKTGRYEGISSVNTLIGEYSTDSEEWAILLTEKCATEVIESEFGSYYRMLLGKVKFWAYKDECFYLYFGNNSYLKYELKSNTK